jgi:hypothetical protein
LFQFQSSLENQKEAFCGHFETAKPNRPRPRAGARDANQHKQRQTAKPGSKAMSSGADAQRGVVAAEDSIDGMSAHSLAHARASCHQPYSQ